MTLWVRPAILCGLLGILGEDSPKGAVDEADVSASSSTSPAYAWFSGADEDPRGSCDLEATSHKRTWASYDEDIVEVTVGTPTGPFKRADRLLRHQEFQYVARSGRRAQVGSFVVLAATRGENDEKTGVRLGVTVSRRVGKAVSRNRVKRRVREWFRYQRPLMRSNLDIVVVARRPAAQISQHEMLRVLDEGIRAVGAVA